MKPDDCPEEKGFDWGEDYWPRVGIRPWTVESFYGKEVASFLEASAKHRLLADKALRYPESTYHATKELETIEKNGGKVVLVAQSPARIVGLIAYRRRQWDSDLFGVPVASIDQLHVEQGNFEATEALLKEFELWAKRNYIRFAFLKAPWQIENARAIAAHGFYLVEAAFNLTRTFGSEDGNSFDSAIRAARTDELPRLLEVCANAGWPGRFHSDPQIGADRAREAYARWLRGGIERDDATITVLTRENIPIGFVLWSIEEMKLGGENVRIADWELSAIDREFQGKGMGTRLYIGALEEIRRAGARHVTQGVSVHNAPALNICIRKLGFCPNYQTFVYHKFY